MPPKIQPKKEKLSWKIAGELRRSQMISTYGSGAIADFPRLSGIMSGIDSWAVSMLPDSAKIHEKNLEKMLGKRGLLLFNLSRLVDEEVERRRMG